MNLRGYQKNLIRDTRAAWLAGHRDVLMVLPTGGGKTVCFASIVAQEPGDSVCVAHRQELVGQISLALTRENVKHRIIGPKKVVQQIIRLQREEVGRVCYSPDAGTAVAGVDTLLRRKDTLWRWAQNVSLWVQDEAHHVLKENKWGKTRALFKNARGLGCTATPLRADGKGLGRHADGYFDTMVSGPSMRDLIENKYLTDYRIFCPPTSFDANSLKVGGTGDYSSPQMRKESQRSQIMGDIVEHYLKIAPGKLGVTFVTDVETAKDTARRYTENGVPAAVVHAKTPDSERVELLRQFRNRKILQLVNVDLFGEGFDLPAIEVVSMARPTMSYGLYSQQFGRSLRILEGKTCAIIIDHVGNVHRHNLPDYGKAWTLDRTTRAASRERDPDEIPLRTCAVCSLSYRATKINCPHCGAVYRPTERSTPDQVDGDLTELSPEALSELRYAVEQNTASPAVKESQALYAGAPAPGARRVARLQQEKLTAVRALKDAMGWWSGYKSALGVPLKAQYIEFMARFGVDVLSAQTMGANETNELTGKVLQDVESMGQSLGSAA